MQRNDDEYIQIMSFLGYDRFRRSGHIDFYKSDVAKSLIEFYFSASFKRLPVDNLNEHFIKKYVKNESELEEVYDEKEREGFRLMYEEALSTPIRELEIFSLPHFHRQLFSKIDNKEFGGVMRTSAAYLKGFPVDLSEPHMIFKDLIDLEDILEDLKKMAIVIKANNNYDEIFDYIRAVIILKCKLIKVHPFPDGNGRTIRCLVNRLFVEAGIPPTYVRSSEKEVYNKAMNEALRYRSASDLDDEKKYDDITSFYFHKVCDSIIQLDVIERFANKSDSMFRSK